MLSPDDIRSLLTELGARLHARGESERLLLAGGAALALHYGRRSATRDIDAVAVEPESLSWDARELAIERGLPVDWLNSNVARFAMDRSFGPLLLVVPGLVVQMVAPEQLLAMKLPALRDDVDYEDARVLIAGMSGSRDDIWARVEPFLVPGLLEWKRQNFDALWEATHDAG